MKNIHVLPTDKPDFVIFKNRHLGDRLFHWNMDLGNPLNILNYVGQNIYITSDEELVLGCYHFNSKYGDEPQKTNQRDIDSRKYWEEEGYYITKIILTTDKDLIKDKVERINDEFLEWFIKNPSCEWVEVESKDMFYDGEYWHTRYKIIIPKKEPKQETLEEAAKNPSNYSKDSFGYPKMQAFIDGAKWQQEQILDFLYSEITERRDYSASKMCEKVIEFIETFKNK